MVRLLFYLFNESVDGIENEDFPAAEDKISREGMAKGLFQSQNSRALPTGRLHRMPTAAGIDLRPYSVHSRHLRHLLRKQLAVCD